MRGTGSVFSVGREVQDYEKHYGVSRRSGLSSGDVEVRLGTTKALLIAREASRFQID